MTLTQAEFYKILSLHIGLMFTGGLLIMSAIGMHRTGDTYGIRVADGLVRRSEKPVYFAFLYYSRLILGSIAFLCGVFSKWQ